jgi:acetylornithine deacetylase/succinyl-diaminopimelate desuccinylase-like protein
MFMEQSQPYYFISQNIRNFLTDLSAFIRIPSVTAESKHRKDVINCADWLAAHLKKIGLEHIQLFSGKQHPIVYADWLHATAKPTLLIYGHYDVQPVDPVNEWNHSPFSGVVKDGFIYGRGSSDDKGQMFAHIKALEFFLKTRRELPVNIKCIFEGEEEIGSPGLQTFIRQYPAFCKADVAVVSDMSIPSADQPAITNSLRGALSFDLVITAHKSDLHSGTFGGAVHSPSNILCDIVTGLHDRNGKIAIPKFYDNVRKKSLAARTYMKSFNRSDSEIIQDAGALCGTGERGYSLYENIVTRPSLSINGLTAGYQGEGPKAIIPSKASAKISFRLVHRQDPHTIEKLFRGYIKSVTPPCVKVSIQKHASAKPVFIDTANIYVKAASKAYENAFKKKVIFQGSGGTIPIVNLLYEDLSIPVILMGFALPGDNPHGPNEKFSISNFCRGIATSIHFLIELEGLNKSGRAY